MRIFCLHKLFFLSQELSKKQKIFFSKLKIALKMDWATQVDDLAVMLSQDPSGPSSAESLVHILQQRFSIGRPFTWVGQDTLLSIGANNTSLSQWEGFSSQYGTAAETSITTTDENATFLPPHILQLASTMFYEMLYHQQDQTVVFT